MLPLSLSLPSPAAADTPGPAHGPAQQSFIPALLLSVLQPDLAPPGTNNFRCRPTARHPRPIVLVHGTGANAYDSWAGWSGRLRSDGYCVFALNYGGQRGTAFRGLTGIADSARELDRFVDKVLDRTRAPKVDLVGHSQGAMMPRYYLKNLGGGSKVRSLTGLAPSNYGTDANGTFPLLKVISSLLPVGSAVLDLPCKACKQQREGSRFLRRLNAGGDTVSGVRYTVVATEFDEVVTPYTNGFLRDQRDAAKRVRNITIQDICKDNRVEHLGIVYDPVALRLVRLALDPSTAKRPNCETSLLPPLL